MINDIERYVQNAKDIIIMLTDHPDFVPHMTRFCDLDSVNIVRDEHPCGTGYCVAGYQAHIEGYPKQYIMVEQTIGGPIPRFDYFTFSEHKCGMGDERPEWTFLYGSHWPNTREAVIDRCNIIILNNGNIPDQGTWQRYGWNDPNTIDDL
jgi:hypothetical protein